MPVFTRIMTPKPDPNVCNPRAVAVSEQTMSPSPRPFNSRNTDSQERARDPRRHRLPSLGGQMRSCTPRPSLHMNAGRSSRDGLT